MAYLLYARDCARPLQMSAHGTFTTVLWGNYFIIPFYRWENSTLVSIMPQNFAPLSVFLGLTACTIAWGLLETRFLRHTLDLPNQSLYFNNTPQWFFCTLNLKKPWSWWHKQTRKELGFRQDLTVLLTAWQQRLWPQSSWCTCPK